LRGTDCRRAGANFALARHRAGGALGELHAGIHSHRPPDCGTWFLPRLVARSRAGARAMGEPLSAEKAEAWGLI
jgi:enoyl-CoA hydratase/carnithine racemase